MDAFRWLAVTFSMILGLGVARVLSGAVAVFKSRHRAELDWVPNAYLSAELALPLLFLIVPAPRLKSTLTVAYLILVLWASLDLSPSAY